MLLFRSKSVTCRHSPLSPVFASSIYRLLGSTPSTQDRDIPSPSPSTTSDFSVEYLIKSCGLPSDQAAKASRYLSHLKSPEKPNAVLQFLRQAGVSEPHVKVVVSRDSRLLCCNVENCLPPRIAELQEIGLSPSDISLLLSICPNVFARNTLQQNVLFWLGIFNSTKELFGVLKRAIFLLCTNLKRTSANLSFLRDQCGLSASQIVQLIKSTPRLIGCTPQALKNKAKRAEELGVRRSSGMFLHALRIVNSLNQSIIDARINNLRSLGFSHEEVTILVSKLPYVLAKSEDIMTRQMEFLTKQAGCDKLHLVSNPSLFNLSMKKRLIPRNLVMNVLKLKGFPVADQKVYSFMKKTEKQFVEKFVLPYEPDIPGFLRACEEACAGNVGGLQWFKSHSS